MVVIYVEAVPDHLRGYLDRYLSEVRTGIFVGSLNRSVSDALWDVVCAYKHDGDAFIVTPCPGEAGFNLRHRDDRRWRITDFDGLPLPSHRRTTTNQGDPA